MYKTETHMHTAEGSACASAAGAQQAEQYKAQGYDTIIITDHFFNGNPAVDRSQPWEGMVEQFCSGYENAKKRGDEIGLNVLFGLEYAWEGADLLVYGVDKKWLLENPDLMQINVREFCDRVHANGGAIVHAHPFREAHWYIFDLKFLPWHTDGVEIYNGGNAEKVWNERAKWYAEQYGFTATAGSDCHHIGGDRFFGVLTEEPITDIAQYVDAVKNKKIAGLYVPEKYK